MSDVDLSATRIFMIADRQSHAPSVEFIIDGAIGYLDRDAEPKDLRNTLIRIGRVAA